jgi:hypothetical protein
MNEKASEVLWSILHERAALRRWTWVESPPHLTRTRFPAESLLHTRQPPGDRPREDDLDQGYSMRPVALVDQTFVVRVIELDALPEDLSTVIAAANIQASIDQAYCPEAADDIFVFFVATRSPSAGRDAWATFAERIERDDRVCRKLVWIPPTGVAAEPLRKAAGEFLDRTFLAEPWNVKGSSGGPQEIDPVQRALASMDTTGLPAQSVLAAWFAALASGDDARIVETLLNGEVA